MEVVCQEEYIKFLYIIIYIYSIIFSPVVKPNFTIAFSYLLIYNIYKCKHPPRKDVFLWKKSLI